MREHRSNLHRRSSEPIDHPSSVGHRMGQLRGEHEHFEPGVQPSSFQPSKASVSAAVIVICLFGPEFANLHPNDDTTWKIYLTAKEAGNAALCCLVAWWVPSGIWHNLSKAVAAIFVTQAIDEGFNSNLFGNSKWEYPAEIVFLLLIALATKLSKRDGGKG
jgi:hypothetical protein